MGIFLDGFGHFVQGVSSLEIQTQLSPELPTKFFQSMSLSAFSYLLNAIGRSDIAFSYSVQKRDTQNLSILAVLKALS